MGAVNAALGRVIASVPTSKVMDVYNAFAKIVPGTVPNKLFSTVDPLAANAAAKAFYEFKDVEGSPLSSAPKAEAEELPGQHPRRDMSMHLFFSDSYVFIQLEGS